MTDEPQTYSEEDVQEILERAMGLQMKGQFTRKQLEDMAADLGIDKDALVTAEENWLAERDEVLAREAYLAHRRQQFVQHLVPYVLVIGFLFFINLMTSPQFWWFLFPALGWGLGLAFHAWSAFGVTEGPEFEQEFEEWRREHPGQFESQKRRRLSS